MERKFNNIPLRAISKICHPHKITLDEFIEKLGRWTENMRELWPKYGNREEAYIEEFFELMLAYNEVEQEPSYTS